MIMEILKGKQFDGFTQNQLKVIAAVFMLIDHIGEELLPQLNILRIIGRLSFPIFAFFIYEGCKYTHSKLRYFIRILLLGLLCMAVYYVYAGKIFGNILITFSLSICVVYSIQFFKACIKADRNLMLGGLAAVCCICCAAVVCSLMYIDYGLCGVLIPAYAEIFDGCSRHSKRVTLLGFGIGLLLLALQMGGNQYFSLLSLPLLAVYNGKRRKLKMKYLFYWFYPVHLAAIGVISMIMG